MLIKEIDKKEDWENFLLRCKEKTFCDSWSWGDFNKVMGDKVFRLGVFDKSEFIAVAQAIKVKAKRGIFLFVPHGPVVAKGDKKEIIKTLLDYLKKLSEKENAIFIRISPILERGEENKEIFKSLGFKEAPIHMHPELTWELDLTVSLEEILKNMRKTTRYLIRQAEKNEDIEIIKGKEEEYLKDFDKLYRETVDRHSFVPFSLDYLKKELDAFKKDNEMLIILGKYQGEVVSVAMIIYSSNKAYYHQGASSGKYSKIPVSYLLQWEAIKEAKARGCETYNFWGIAETEDKNHPWHGLSLFKKGFGGQRKEYVKTQDYILSPFYFLTFMLEYIRRKKRRL